MKKYFSVKFIMWLLVAIVVGVFLGRTIDRVRLIWTTDPPPAYMVQNLEKQLECAKKAGFTIKKPILRIMRRPYRSDIKHGYAHMMINIITLIDFASYATLAHEIGHIIDYQTDHQMHPTFTNKKELQKENYRGEFTEQYANAVRDVILNECIGT